MLKKKNAVITITTILAIFIISGCYIYAKQVPHYTKVEKVLKNTIKTTSNKLDMKNIEFLTFGAGDADRFKDVIINYNGNYNNSTIKKEALEYAKAYFSEAMTYMDVQKLDGLNLYIQLQGVDEKGNKSNSQLSITIQPNKIKNVNWSTLTSEDLQKISVFCHLDPTQPA